MYDIYFNHDFGKIHESLGEGTCEVFKFHSRLGAIRHMFMKREIPIRIDGEIYYNLVTPAAYGGPVISGCSEDYKWNLIYDYTLAFEEYCKENRIISEYVRFHPVASNATDFSGFYEIDYVCDTYGTNLKAFLDPVHEEFSSSCHETIWRVLQKGVTYQVTEKPKSLESYVKFYAHFVENWKTDYQYLIECGNLFREQIVLVEAIYKNQVIGMNLSFLSNKVIHTHSTVINPAFEYLFPAQVMHYGLTLWGKANGQFLIHDGGWLVMNSQTQDFANFKKQFSRYTSFKLYTGKRIWNEEKYWRLREMIKGESNSESYQV